MTRRGADSRATSVTLTNAAHTLVIELGELLGLDNQDVIELALRKLAREWGLTWTPATRCRDGSEQAAGPSDTF